MFSVPVIWLLSPVENANKELDLIEKLVYRKKARIILVIELVIVILLILQENYSIALIISTALLTICIMLVWGKLKNVINVFRATNEKNRTNYIDVIGEENMKIE